MFESLRGDFVSESNLVRLTGVVVLDPTPVGDDEVSWRVRVPRGGGGHDQIPCRAPASARWASKLAAGDVVELEGELRSRFWRSGGSTQSRVEVEVTHLKRRRAARAS